MCTNLAPKGSPKRPIWNPMDILKTNKSSKICKKYSKGTDPKAQHKKVTFQDPPKLQKVSFYHGKTNVFKNHLGPEKVTKMTAKGSPNGSQIDSNCPQRSFQGLQKDKQETKREKDTKKDQKINPPAFANFRW